MTTQAKVVVTAQDQTATAFASVSRNFSTLQQQALSVQGKLLGVSTAIATAVAALGAVRNINFLDKLDDLAEKTGIAVEKLSELRFAGEATGTPIDALAGGVQKLSKLMAAAAGGNQEAIATFKALNVEVKNADGSLRSSDDVLGDLANRFKSYEDGAAKAALAQRVFGKSGAEMIPLLNQGADGIERLRKEAQQLGAIYSGELAKQAADFNDNLTKLKIASEAAGISLLGQFLPALNRVLQTYLELKKAGRLSIFNQLTELPKALFNAGDPGADINELMKERARIEKRRSFAESKGLPTRDFDRQLEGNVADLDTARAVQRVRALEDLGDVSDAVSRRQQRGQAPIVQDKEKTGDAQALLKKQLDGRLKAIEEFYQLQKIGIEHGNAIAKAEYDAGEVALEDLFKRQQAARDGELKAQTDALDKEIAALTAYRNNPILKPQEREDAQNKIAEAEAKRSLAVVKASNAAQLATKEEAKAREQLRDRYIDFQATVLELQGKTFDAEKARIAKQVREAGELATQAGQDPATAQAALEAGLIGRAKLTEAQRRYGLLLDEARDKEEALHLTAQTAGSSEAETLQKVGAQRQATLVQMEELLRLANQIKEETGTPEAIAFARNLALGFQRAVQEADPLLQKVRDIGREAGDSIANGLGNAIAQGGTLRDVLRGIERDLINIGARALVTKPLGDWVSNALGGNGQPSGGGGLLGGFLGRMLGFGGGRDGGFGTGARFGNLDFGGNFADGGTLQPGQWGIAGENGPEPIYAGATPLHITPAGGPTVHYNPVFHIAGPVDRRTQDQIAAAAFAGAQRALARNG